MIMGRKFNNFLYTMNALTNSKAEYPEKGIGNEKRLEAEVLLNVKRRIFEMTWKILKVNFYKDLKGGYTYM
jgi:hypothetical protein